MTQANNNPNSVAATPAIIAIGDCMVMMNPTEAGPLAQLHKQYTTEYAGAEINLLIGCRRLGFEVGLLSALGDDPFGKMIYDNLQREGVDVSQVQWDAVRPTPLFFKERAANGKTIAYYYRRDAAGAFVDAAQINADYFSRARVFYFTGIFPALSAANAQLIHTLLPQLKACGITIAFDPSIRLKLFKNHDAARQLITPFLSAADILLLNHEEAQLLFGTDDATKVFAQCAEHNINTVALTYAENGAVVSINGSVAEQKTVATTAVDSRGAGDAFNVGFLYGILNNHTAAECARFAAHTAAFAVASLSDNADAPTLPTLLTALKTDTE